MSLHDLLSTDRRLLYVSFITSLKSNSYTALTIHNTTEMSFITLHAQNTTALQLKVLLTGMPVLMVISHGRSALPSANHCHGQLQTSQPLSVLDRQMGEHQSHSERTSAPTPAPSPGHAPTKPIFRMSNS